MLNHRGFSASCGSSVYSKKTSFANQPLTDLYFAQFRSLLLADRFLNVWIKNICLHPLLTKLFFSYVRSSFCNQNQYNYKQLIQLVQPENKRKNIIRRGIPMSQDTFVSFDARERQLFAISPSPAHKIWGNNKEQYSAFGTLQFVSTWVGHAYAE